MNSRILGIDFGQKFVGVAISDPLFITAQSLTTIERPRADKLRKTLASLKSLCEEYSVEKIVIGFPKNLDGSENERCKFTKEFAESLFKRTEIPIFLWDERLTTVDSDRELEFLGIKDKKAHSDELSAVMILEGFMAAINNGVSLTPYISN